MAALRWGICSAGKVSHDFLVGLKALPETSHSILAVAARSLESAQAFATKHSIPQAYGSYEELAKDPQLDVIYIGTITPSHLSCAKMMVEAGKAVLCEKPLTMNSEETKQLIAFAREKNVFLMEAIWMRFFPAMFELRRLIASGSIGDINYVNVSFGFHPKLGGGATLDIGVYAINFTSMVFGGEKPEKIHAEGTLSDEGTDNLAAVTITYPGGRIAQLSISIKADLPCEAFVYGTKGQLKVPKWFWCPTKLETPEGTKEFPLPKPYQPTNFANSEGMCYEAEEVRRCLQEGKKESDIMTLNETQLVADIMDDIMKQLGVIYFK
uniref:Trans-1,2-dihydrobenzene-1,2-diol dehydrogenase n=1 Tax=Amphimedon queenslandica TaxID=400682 RepID=A0A1X7UZZ8_AMPQE